MDEIVSSPEWFKNFMFSRITILRRFTKEENLQFANPNPLSQKNALPYLLDPWNCNGHWNGSCICQPLYGRNGNKNDKWKQHKRERWKRYGDNIFPLWVFQHIENKPVYKLTISTLQSSCLLKSRRGKLFLTQLYFKGERIWNKSILDIRTHINPTETFTKIIT